MKIRTAQPKDWDEILSIYARARAYMRSTGNPDQWKDSSPAPSVLEQDIRAQQLYLLENGDGIQGVFALIPGPDPTYSYIEGSWLNDAPYAAIHRVASAGHCRGVLGMCLDYCAARFSSLRIDTHHDNLIMQHLLEKHGFTRCGIIYLANGDPRIAYHRTG